MSCRRRGGYRRSVHRLTACWGILKWPSLGEFGWPPGKRIFAATRVVSYRVFFFTLYSLGLRLGEGLRLQVGDIDAARGRVHIRDAKGNRDRFVPLPQATHKALQRFWHVHRNPVLLFPNRHGGLKGAAIATTHMDRGGVQTSLHQVVGACGLKKRSRLTR